MSQLNFLNPLSLQPDGLNLWYFSYITELIVWNIHWVVTKIRDYKIRVNDWNSVSFIQYCGNPALSEVLPIQGNPLSLEVSTQTRNISVVLPSLCNQNLKQICPGVHELWSDTQKRVIDGYRKQTSKNTYFKCQFIESMKVRKPL